jgi:hypothetical protein
MVRHGEDRMALGLGNGAYKDSPLETPVNDVQGMANAMKACGATRRYLTD